MSGSRISDLEPTVIQQLRSEDFYALEVIEELPESLTTQEVNELGLLAAYTRKEEDKILFSLGAAAVVTQDTDTASSIIEHIQRRPWTIAGVVGAFTLKRELKARSNDRGLQTT